MKLTLIGQEINALTLGSVNAKTLLWELPKKMTQSLSAQVCFLIPFVSLPTASWSRENGIDKRQLTLWEAKLQTILWKTQEIHSNESEVPINLLADLQQELALPHWEVCPIAQDQLWGWLILGSNQELGLNSRLESSLASALCLAMKTAQLQFELHKKERYKWLQQNVTELIHNSQDLETILYSAIAQTSQALEVTRGIVLMLRYAEPIFGNRREINNPNVEVQLLTQWAQSSPFKTSLTSFPLSNSPLCLKAWQQAPIPLSQQVVDDPYQLYFLEESCPTSAWIITPLMGTSSGRPESQMVLGFLLLENDQPRQWYKEEQELLSWVSTEVSTTIVHNKTLQRVQSLVDERTAQLQRSLDVQAKLYETSRNQVEQLQELNQLKDEFLATISHELNTPLATMKMAIRMLHNEALPPERKQKYLGILEQEWNREHNLIKDLLTLQKVEDEGTSLQVKPVNVKQLLREIADEFQWKWQEKQLDLTLRLAPPQHSDERFTIESDEESVRRIVLELLSNAGKYSRAKTTVEIMLSETIHNWICMSVKNIGYGIAPSEQSYIFDRFRRGKGATQKAIPGTGLGLALVQSLVQHLRGKIDLNSEYNPDGVGETTFHVTLPRSLDEVLET
ncbi:GAF sensor signal transduction histidine kinase [Halothece sp. PCC 7418]|uniref:sensor histidine kinase n=1 Tax=Halothece sp. (strain PCC 7418) TaxID=65093 RepID=UPI0002A08123|nr:ATP-binding protein [Halothece sp. PCC 7418]AFZ42985.1 GAF sensor signal transduction histidine kinase [Halothece sp. PCC 7418]